MHRKTEEQGEVPYGGGDGKVRKVSEEEEVVLLLLLVVSRGDQNVEKNKTREKNKRKDKER